MSEQTALLEKARQLYLSGQWGDVVPLCEDILKRESSQVDAWLLLATSRHRLGQTQDALHAVNQALLADPFRPALHAFAGELWLALQNPGEAERAFRRAIAANPDFTEAHNSLGTLLRDAGKLEEAIESFQRALKINPNFAVALNNLGACCLEDGRPDEAENALRQAIRLDPQYAAAHFNLGRLYVWKRDDARAREHLDLTIKARPDRDDAHYLLGTVLQRLGEFKAAIQSFHAAAKLQPQNAEYVKTLAEILWEQGDLEASLALYRHVLSFAPEDLRAEICSKLLLPVVYGSSDEVRAARNRFEQGLDKLTLHANGSQRISTPEIERQIQWSNFYLAYQGQDDKHLQIRYAKFMREMLARQVPDMYEKLSAKDPRQRRLKVGFVSNYFYDCTAGRYFSSWITDLDNSRFESIVYHVGAHSDALTADIRASAGSFKDVVGLSLFSLARLIRADELDVLIFPELGMHPLVFCLASFRLAPVQCAGWGHPVTSGHENVDYFLSSAFMEPENAQAHYSESLYCLPGLGTNYRRPATLSSALRADFQLPVDSILYLVPQSPYKIHPDNDELFLEILESEPDAVIVMFHSERQMVARTKVIERLESGFKRRNLATAGRVRMLPMVPHDEYLRINQLCDVMLDTMHWSGGNTSLDAIAAGLPIVTLPGKYMRGRQSQGMLNAMNCDELIAADHDDYVQIALDLGRDPRLRFEVSQKLIKNRERLFGQTDAIRAIEAFLVESVTKKFLSS